jgi:hypothetical protein
MVTILYLEIYPLILLAVLPGELDRHAEPPAAQAMLADLTPPDQLVMTTAMYRLAINLGTAVTPLVGVALVSVSYDLLFWAEAAAALTYGVIALRYLPGRVAPDEQAARGPGGPTAGGILAVLSDWRYVFYWEPCSSSRSSTPSTSRVLPLAIVDSGLSLWWYSAVVSVNAAIVALLEVPATKYVQPGRCG